MPSYLRARRVVSPIAIILIWEGLALIGVFNPLLFPSPYLVLSSAYKLVSNGQLIVHIVVSLQRIIAGYLLATVLGILTGLGMGYSKKMDDAVDPLIELFRAIPTIALIPLAILWMGIGNESKIFLIFYATYFPIVISTVVGVRKVEPIFVSAARTLGANSRVILRRVILPGALPSIFGGLRISMGIAFIVIVAAELVGSNSGLGYLILTAQEFYDTPTVFVGILTIAFLSFVFDQAFRRVQRTIMPWET